jgi:hypothetical protein
VLRVIPIPIIFVIVATVCVTIFVVAGAPETAVVLPAIFFIVAAITVIAAVVIVVIASHDIDDVDVFFSPHVVLMIAIIARAIGILISTLIFT